MGARGRTGIAERVSLFLVALVATLALLPASASAVATHPALPFSPIDGTGTGVTFRVPSGIAVEEATGNLVVNNGYPLGYPHNDVDVFGAEGGVPAGLRPPYMLPDPEPLFEFIKGPTGVAVDNSPSSPARGTLYVADTFNEASGGNTGNVERFTYNPGTEGYEFAGHLIPEKFDQTGGGAEKPYYHPTGVAVNAAGDVFVADWAGERVLEFGPAGEQLAEIDVTASFQNPNDVALDAAGDLFVSSFNEGSVYEYPADGAGQPSASNYLQVEPPGKAYGLAVDTARNILYVAHRGGSIAQYGLPIAEADPQPQLEFNAGAGIEFRSRIAVNSASGRIYVSNAEAKVVEAFGYGPNVPGLSLDAAGAITATKATLAGTVLPEGEALAECVFEYGETTAYGQSAPCEGSVPADEEAHPVSAALSGLDPDTAYHYRLVVANANGANHSVDRTLTTAELAQTGTAGAIAATRATLNGTVLPEGEALAECVFEYGETTAYGQSAPCEGSVPADEAPHAVGAALTGLSPDTAYHYRLSIEGGLGAAQGADKTFATFALAQTGAADPIAGTKATVHGTVRPEGQPLAECVFEYGETTAYGNTAPCEGSVPADEAPHAVAADLTHLVPDGTTYHYRLSIEGGLGAAQGADKTFATAATVLTGAAGEATAHALTLGGTVDPEEVPLTECVFEYGETTAYGQSAPCESPAAAEITGSGPVSVHARVEGLALATVYHYRLAATSADGTARGADESAKTASPPAIEAERTVSVGSDEAVLRVTVNPEGFPATFRVEYGETTAYGQSTATRSVGDDRLGHTVTVVLEGLAPGTAYHWRVSTVNEIGEAAGPDRAFATYRAAAAGPECPNRGYRVGPAAALPDCRAYEMVSPLDKDGGGIIELYGVFGVPPLDQAAVSGDGLAYGSYKAFGDARSSLYNEEYVARRRERGEAGEGWHTHGVSPPAEGEPIGGALVAASVPEFFIFSPDLCQAWHRTIYGPPLTPEALSGYHNLYRRTDSECGGPSYEALTTARPRAAGPQVFKLELQGLSADGARAFFAASGQITPDAPIPTADLGGNPEKAEQLYESSAGELHFLCVLPDGRAAQSPCSAGGPAGSPAGQGFGSDLSGAVSADGQRVFWTVAGNEAPRGPIYLRVHPDQPQSALEGSAEGSGTLTEGSTSVTNLIAAEAAAGFAAGSEQIELGPVKLGEFLPGATIAVSGFPAGTKVTACSPDCAAPTALSVDHPSTAAKTNVKIVSRGPMPFAPGTTIGGEGIPDGTTIEAVEAGKLTLSQPAAATAGGVSLLTFGPCSEPQKACTIAISAEAEAEAGTAGAYYLTGSEGRRAIFSVGKELYEATVAEEGGRLVSHSRPIAGGVPVNEEYDGRHFGGFLGASEDAGRLYFTSTEVLTAGPNAQGKSPTEGLFNLYFYDAGRPAGQRFSFIGTSPNGDEFSGFSPRATGGRPDRVTPDGLAIAFSSTVPFTGYDNTDQASGRPDYEVYLYEAEANEGRGKLVCASCNPSGTAPRGTPYGVNLESGVPEQGAGGTWVSAVLPGPRNDLYSSHPLAAGGRRLFFDGFEALTPADTNGVEDVYEWEAPGEGTCTAQSPSYSTRNEGCIYLISSGTSPEDSEFVDADPTGENAFFKTLAGLLPKDPGLVDIYDARVDGGFPEPVRRAACEGEACQSAPEAPNDPTPASSSFEGAGNVHEEAQPRQTKRCPKGKVKRKGRCVRKHGKKTRRRCAKGKVKRHGKCVRVHRRRARHNRRAGR